MRLKSISEILTRLVDLTLINTHEINDFSVGSTILSIYESVSMELEQYYVLGRENILWGIEEGVYEAFDFPRRPARKAYGEITIEFHTALTSPLYISRGNSFHSSLTGYNQKFETLQDYIVPAGTNKAVVTVYCTQEGVIGNVPRNVINLSANNLTNIKKITNDSEFLTGTEQESLDNVKQRFQSFVETRGRATKKSIIYGARTVEDIAGVYVKEETGYIKVYAHDLNGNLSTELKAQVESALEDYRPSGIKMDVVPVEKKPVDLNIKVTLTSLGKKTDIFNKEITEQVTRYLNRMTASDDLILSEIVQLVMNIDDYAIYDCVITNLKENLIIEDQALIRAGTITITLV